MKKLVCILVILSFLLSCGICHADSDASLQEGYTEEKDGYTAEVRWCKNGDKNIYGRFFYPEGFDPEQSYPVVIMSHGLGSTAKLLELGGWAQAVTAEGYIGYAFDFCGGSPNSRSDGSYSEMSVRTEQRDLEAVIDFVQAQPFTDSGHLFLLGQSQGGFVTALAASARAEDVKAVILMYPALCLVDDLHRALPSLDALTGDTYEAERGPGSAIYARDAYDIDVMEEISGYTGDVMVVHGINDIVVPYSYAVDAVTKAYAGSNSELLLLTGKKAVHSFEMAFEEGRIYAEQQAVAFMNAHLG